MSNYNNNIRGKNQRNSNQDWNNDNDQDRNRFGSDNDRFDNDDRTQNYGSGFGSSNQNDRSGERSFDSNRDSQRQDSQRNDRFGSDRWNNDNNFGSSYGSDRGQGQRRNDNWETGRDFGNYNSGNANSGSSNSGAFNSGSDFGGSRSSRSGYGSSGYGSNDFSNDRNRNQNQDRGWWDKTRDEVSSWFGDDNADRRRQQDGGQSQQNSHRGRGPKGYTRSDERIKEDINDRLSDDHHIDASNIDVAVTNGEVVLTGSVDDRRAKRHAEDLAEAISGVKNVENRIRVGNENSNSSSAANSNAKNSANAATAGITENKKA